MPHKPDLPCATCGKLLWRGNTSLPEGEATCRSCREAARLERERIERQRLEELQAARVSIVRPVYGYNHQEMRARLAPIVEMGGWICTRYEHPQFPDCPGEILPGDPWDLGHDDRNVTRWSGPEHQACNRKAGALKAAAQLELNVEAARIRILTHSMPKPAKPRRLIPVPEPMPPAECVQCGSTFTPKFRANITCSKRCSTEYNKVRVRNRYRAKVGIAEDAPLWTRAS